MSYTPCDYIESDNPSYRQPQPALINQPHNVATFKYYQRSLQRKNKSLKELNCDRHPGRNQRPFCCIINKYSQFENHSFQTIAGGWTCLT